ncbi:hypothetical protein P7C70_g1989, partial [Phenoliferia sp. Uapishka_3]
MSRPPNSTGSSSSNHGRRASTHSIGVSYAYGAPSVGSPGPPSGRSGAALSARGSGAHASPSNAGDDAPSVISGSTALGEEEGEATAGRPRESAAVRYQRIKQRTKDTGQPFLAKETPPDGSIGKVAKSLSSNGRNDTSVNIATAFREATRGNGGVVQGQRRGFETQEEHEDDQRMDEADDGGKETHVAGPASGEGMSKKRKKRTSKDPTFKPTGEELSTDEELGEGLARGKAKRSRVTATAGESPSPVLVKIRLPGDEHQPSPAPNSAKKASSRRKSGDPTYRPTATSDAETESEESDYARRKRKGKGRASGGGTNAIPIGRRDGEVWYGKKRKGRKGARRSGDGVEGEEDELEGESMDQDLGGHDEITFDLPDDDDAPASTSFFLRPKSPSPSAPNQSVESSPAGHTPFSFSMKNVQPDPAFDSFDRTLNSRRSESFDDSGVRGSSYDYSEEERIVAALEREKAAASSAANARAGASGVRNRYRVGPPPSREPDLGDIQEEEELKRGSLGRSVGLALRPVWSFLSGTWQALQNPLLDWSKIAKAAGLALALLSLLIFLSTRPTTAPAPITSHHRSFTDYIPFYPSQSSYSTPSLPAESIEELVARLSILEKAMGQLSTISEAERTRAERDRKRVGKISDQVSDLEESLESERKRATKALEASDKSSAKEAAEIERSVRDIRDVLEQLGGRVKALAGERETDQDDIKRLQSGVASVGKDIASLGSKVAQVSKDLEAGLDAERISKIALEAIEARLPSRLAVRLDSRGKLEIDPAFWKHLRDAFAEKKDVDALVSDKVANEVAKRGAKSAGSSPPPVVVTKEPSWDDFLSANEVSLRSWVSSDINNRVGSDAIVSRRTFLDLLHREIKTLKVDFEAKSNENVQKIGQELLDKVAKQEQMRKEGGIASHLNPFSRGSASQQGTPSQITIKSTDGQNISAIISSLVDSALLRYSKDVLARPDYALYTSGGRVIPSLTSPTYEARPLGLTPKLLSWASGSGSTPGRPPVTALHPDNSLGSCWPFAGTQGQLGILLSRPVVPSDVTIEHVSVDIALDGDVSSAPKDFEVWGVVEGRADIERLAEYRSQEFELRRKAVEEGQDVEEEEMTSLPLSPKHMLLVAGQYDISAAQPIQTFPVQAAARQLGIPVGVVVVKFLSNHGESHYTCIYRVRLSGLSEAASAAATSSSN